MPIKAIIFDYGNVIARFDVQIYMRGIIPYTSLSPKQLADSMKSASPIFVAYETGELTSGEFLATLSEQCALSISQDDFLRIYNGIFTPIETTRDLIRQLYGRYRLALLSNTSEWHYQHEISHNPIFPLFDTVTVSHEVKARKPAEAIYRDALAKLDLPPGTCAYVDDIEEFANAATQLGMHGIHYTAHDALLRSLADLGVVVRA